MRRASDRGDAELLAAYVDGVAELSLEERKRVDDLLARDPALRSDEAETRAVIGQLRDLPPVDNEPDWTALSRSIGDAVGRESISQPWWRRLRWRIAVPAIALAMTVAVVALVLHEPAPAAVPEPAPPPVVHADEPEGAAADELAASTPLWLDGTDLEIALEAAELFDLAWELDDDDALPRAAELLAPADPADRWTWIDELDGEALDRAEQILDRAPHRGGPS